MKFLFLIAALILVSACTKNAETNAATEPTQNAILFNVADCPLINGNFKNADGSETKKLGTSIQNGVINANLRDSFTLIVDGQVHTEGQVTYRASCDAAGRYLVTYMMNDKVIGTKVVSAPDRNHIRVKIDFDMSSTDHDGPDRINTDEVWERTR